MTSSVAPLERDQGARRTRGNQVADAGAGFHGKAKRAIALRNVGRKREKKILPG